MKKFFERKTLCSLFKKNLHHDGDSGENKKPMNQAIYKNPIHSFNENKNNKQNNLVFSNA
jgi:hypothetical protein